MSRRIGAMLLLAWAAVVAPGALRALAKDEAVRFFPGYARWEESSSGWRAHLAGWVYEPERDSVVRQVLAQSLLRFTPGDVDRTLFERRLVPFLVDAEEGKLLKIRWPEGVGRVRTGDGGAFLWEGLLPRSPDRVAGTTVTVRTRPRRGDRKTFEGRLLLIGPEGTSVVSDVDDTIKISSAPVRRELLANTFFRPWEEVPGMAELYGAWAREGAVFHYVSKGPWPLEPETEDFLRQKGFPSGAMHFRRFAPGAVLAEEVFPPLSTHKREVIERLMADFPRRRFVLVGDSGEEDPEIYGEIARSHGKQVLRVFIRRVTADPDSRYQAAFRGVEENRWTVFDDPRRLWTPEEGEK